MIDMSLNLEKPTLSRDVDIVLQQIDILFDTYSGEVFGEENYGSNFERFLWDMRVSNSSIEQYTKNLITSNVNLMGFEVNVEVLICQGTMNDIIIIRITLSRESEEYEKTYKIS